MKTIVKKSEMQKPQMLTFEPYVFSDSARRTESEYNKILLHQKLDFYEIYWKYNVFCTLISSNYETKNIWN